MRRIAEWLMFGFAAMYAVGKGLRVWLELTVGLPQGFDYEITTWLIDYRGGFVRRGLVGEGLWWLKECLGIDPLFVIVPVAIGLYLALAAFLLLAFRRRGWIWWIVPTTLLLGGVDVLRTDGLVLCLVVGIVASATRIKQAWLRLLAVNVIAVLGVLVHEVVFFMTVPMLVWLELGDDELPMPKAVRPIVLAPVVLALSFATMCSGDAVVRDVIVSGWHDSLGDWWSAARYLGVSVGLTPADVIGANVAHLTTTYLGVPAWVFVPIGVVFAGAFICVTVGSLRVMGLLALQFVSLVPVFVCLCDPSRALCFWLFGSLMWMLFVEWDRLPLAGCVRTEVPMLMRRVVLAVSLVIGVPYVGYSPLVAVGQSPIGTWLTFAFGKVLVEKGYLLTPGYPMIEAWAR